MVVSRLHVSYSFSLHLIRAEKVFGRANQTERE